MRRPTRTRGAGARLYGLGVALAFIVAAIAASACTVHQTDTPALAGPSEFGQSVTVTATPDSISQDGFSQSEIVVVARDANGNPLSGLSIRLDMEVSGVLQDFGRLSARTVMTSSNGRATATYTAPPAPPASTAGGGGTIMRIRATPTGSNFQAAVSQSADIRLVPPGVILPPAGTPVPDFSLSPTTPTANTAVQFDASGSQAGSNAAITSYSWSFGDGTSGTGRTTSHTYTAPGIFNVTLTVTNDRGLAASSSQSVTVSAGTVPGASFVFSPVPVTVGADVFFDAGASRPGAGHTIVQYLWNWGDGSDPVSRSTSIGQHNFATVGVYTVTLTVIDEAGQRGTANQTVAVGSASPTASFTTVISNPATHTIQADGGASTVVGNATITNYAWTWGDGATTSGSAAVQSHAYAAAGTYVVQLTITDSNGRSSSKSGSVTVP